MMKIVFKRCFSNEFLFDIFFFLMVFSLTASFIGCNCSLIQGFVFISIAFIVVEFFWVLSVQCLISSFVKSTQILIGFLPLQKQEADLANKLMVGCCEMMF